MFDSQTRTIQQSRLKIGQAGDKYGQVAENIRPLPLIEPIQMQTEEEEDELQMNPTEELCPRCRERMKKNLPLNCPDCEEKLQMKPGKEESEQRQSMAIETQFPGVQKQEVSNSVNESIIQRACGSSAIGDPRDQCQGQSGLTVGPRFLFRVNCDELRTDTSPTQEVALRNFAAYSIVNGDQVDVHGFASEDGGAEYNDKLSCARAVRAKQMVDHEISTRGISATVNIYRHGEVPGDHEEHRAVVIETQNEEPSTDDPTQVTFTPCTTFPKSLGTRGACGAGTDFTFHDFPTLSTSDSVIVAPYRLRTDTDLLLEMRGVLSLFGGSEGSDATTRFAAGTGTTHRFGPTHGMSTEAQATPTFQAVVRDTQSQLNTEITSQAASGVIDCNSLSIPVGSLPGISFPPEESLRLKAIIGGTQGLEVFLTNLTVNTAAHTYQATLRFEICDDFGVDHHDLYAPGLIPFWVLQHERRGFQPYIHELVIDESISDSF